MALIGSAHLIAGGEEGIGMALELLRREDIDTDANPDLSVRRYATFGIDDARELRERAALAGQRGGRMFIVQAAGMTAEAQNALLKTVEEPPEGTLFFFIVQSPQTLLPTLRSRMQMLRIDATVTPQPFELHASVGSATVTTIPDARGFLSASPSERLELLKPLLEKGDEGTRDMASVLAFLSSLERTLDAAGARDGLESIYRARKYAGDRGALLKPLLEQVALLAPVLS